MPEPVPRPVQLPPEAETPAGNAPVPASPAPGGPGIPAAAKTGAVIAACLLLVYAAWHHIAVALQGIF
ncbi:hypothetical protein [Mesorhizobium carmichaelinearum]|uniref:hypothetical protein n=1 Tax=Mesorhizobium carmichaelinearum TaxID=1208188 RepID=UPI000BA4668A|nr:hypothetical protein [Mesorhizobium carmichaelinearum]